MGKLSMVGRDGSITDVYEHAGWEGAGVETRGATTFFLESVGAGGDPAGLEGYLKAINVRGEVRTIAELASFERNNNPDGQQHYGSGPEVSPTNAWLASLSSHRFVTRVSWIPIPMPPRCRETRFSWRMPG